MVGSVVEYQVYDISAVASVAAFDYSVLGVEIVS